MSYDIRLVCPCCKNPVTVEQFEEGGTYPSGGTTEAEINITYNYAPHYTKYLDKDKGIRVLYGKTGAEAVELLEFSIGSLSSELSDDYWCPTQGNAKKPLIRLLGWAKSHPTAIFEGD